MIVLSIPLDLSIALVIVAIAAAFGILLGSVAGWLGGKLDEAILRITDIFFAFPGLVLALVFAALFGRTIQTLTIAVLLVWWPVYVRLARGQVLAEKGKTYVEALRGLGVGSGRIVVFHIIPNTIYPNNRPNVTGYWRRNSNLLRTHVSGVLTEPCLTGVGQPGVRRDQSCVHRPLVDRVSRPNDPSDRSSIQLRWRRP